MYCIFFHQAGFAAEGTETGTPFPEVNLLEKVRTQGNKQLVFFEDFRVVC